MVATYKTTKYALLLHFLAMQVNVNVNSTLCDLAVYNNQQWFYIYIMRAQINDALGNYNFSFKENNAIFKMAIKIPLFSQLRVQFKKDLLL